MPEAPDSTGRGPGGLLSSRSFLGVVALLCIALAYALLLRPAGCGPNSHYALVRALDHGRLSIGRYQWQTCDKSYFRNNFYSNKAPGLAFVALPVYAGLHALGLAHENLPSTDSIKAMGDNTDTAIWPLALIGAVIPSLILLLLVRRFGDALATGYGTAAAVTLGLGTLLLPFGSLFIQHALSTTLAFGAFMLMWREREGPGRPLLLAAAGIALAYAASVEYPLAVTIPVLSLYAILGRPHLLRRTAALGLGGLIGIVPLLVYNRLAFGSITHLSYADAVLNQGQTGHDELGAQSRGVYGVTSPRLDRALHLLLYHRGLLVLTPIVLVGFLALIALFRRGRRAEALALGFAALAIFGYDTGFGFGGDVPGPRFLIPGIAFVSPALALAWRRIPLTTLVLAAVSAICMGAATLGTGSWGGEAVWPWFVSIGHGKLAPTLFSLVGAGTGWIGLAPVLLAIAAAIGLAVWVTPRPPFVRRDAELACACLAGWLLLSGVTPMLLERRSYGVDFATILLLGAVAVALWRTWERGAVALLAGLPLLVLLAPSLTRSPAAVALAATCALLAAALMAGAQRSTARA